MADYLAVDGISAVELADPDVLGPLVRRRWPDAEPSVAATLWWYSASSTLTLVPVAQMLVTGSALDVRPDVVTVHLDDAGTPDALSSIASLHGPDELGAALGELCSLLIDTVSTLGSVHQPSLWAIASDSLANRALDVGTALGRIAEATEVAQATALAAGMPRPRFVDIDRAGESSPAGSAEPAAGRRRFLQRSSCCLVFEVGDRACSSCPRQRPETRIARLAALVG